MAPASGMKAPAAAGSTSAAEAGAPVRSGVSMGIFGIAADIHVIEDGERVLRQHSERAVERDEIGGDGLAVDAHEADGEARRDLSGHAGLKEPDDALLLFAGVDQQNLARLGAFL